MKKFNIEMWYIPPMEAADKEEATAGCVAASEDEEQRGRGCRRRSRGRGGAAGEEGTPVDVEGAGLGAAGE